MRSLPTIAAAVLLIGLAQPRAATAGLIGRIDTFEDGTTQGWEINLLGIGAPPTAALPTNVPTGGPAGADDNFLRLAAFGGTGAGSRLSVVNFMNQWAGDYLAEGVTAFRMDLINLGTTDLSHRLMFANPTVGPPTDLAFSTEAVVLPAGGGWTPVMFPVRPADLTAGIGSVDDALANTTELRLYHSQALNFPNPVSPIEPVVAQLGVDNIRAVNGGSTPIIPEPSSILLAGTGLLALAGWRTRRGKAISSAR